MMQVREPNFRGLPIHGQHSLSHAGAAIMGPQPLVTIGPGPFSSRRAGSSRGADPSSTATVIPFLLPRSSAPVQPVPPSTQSAATSAKRADQKLITREQEYRQRMFENLLAAGWVGILMSAGYYMLNVLAAPSM